MKRIEELDFTRIIAMIAVITIHVTSAFSLTNFSAFFNFRKGNVGNVVLTCCCFRVLPVCCHFFG